MAIDQLSLALALGTSATEVRRLLVSHHLSLSLLGGFDAAVAAGVRDFQVKAVDEVGRPLLVDGVVGARTLAALRRTDIPEAPLGHAPLAWPPAHLRMAGALAGAALKTAFDELLRWNNDSPGQRGQRERYRSFANIDASDDWSAAFVSWCLAQGETQVRSGHALPQSAGARELFNQVAKDPGAQAFAVGRAAGSMPQCGDVLVWWRKNLNAWQGHVGFVHDFDGVYVDTIEGNAGDAVRHKRYQYPFDYPVNDGLRNPRGFLGLIRLP